MTHRADLAVVERVLRETGVEQTVPSPGWSAYVQAILERLIGKLFGAFPDLKGVATLLGPVAVVIAAILVLAIAAVLVHIAVEARQRRRLWPRAATDAASAREPPAERDRAGWREEVERCLARGDLAAALEALWWWFARAISTSPVDRAWTSNELLSHCRRPDLTPIAGRLDTLLYGSRRPGADDVRSFLSRAEEGLS